MTIIRISCKLSDRRKLLLFLYNITVFWLILHLSDHFQEYYYSFLFEFKYAEIDFDLFQEAITFKTT